MRTSWFRVAVLSALLTLAVTSVASAHVRVLPEEVPAGSFEVFTVRVPTELEEEGGVVSAFTWSGGEIGATEFQQFDVQGQTPEEPGDYPWSAFQTYEDGEVIEWTGPEDSEEPASVVRVVEGDPNEAATQETDSGTTPSVGGLSLIAAYGGLVLGALALVLALVALLRRNK
jgi:uncharacterized protein YcnI